MTTSPLSLAMVSICVTATNAFTSTKIDGIRRSPSSSLISVRAYLDGVYYEPSSHASERITAEVWELGLLRDETFDHSQEYIAGSLVNLVGLSEYDAYEIVRQTLQVGVCLIEDFPLEIAEFYQEELAKLGIRCEIVPIEE